jgi:Flp pilus assembly protein TadG
MIMNPLRLQAGAIVVEMALVTIPLVILTFGVSEFGRAIYQYNALAKGARDAARHLSQYAPGDSARIAEAKCLAAFGSLDCSGARLAPGMSVALVTVHDRSTNTGYNLQGTGRGAVNLVGVEVSGFQFASVAPLYVPSFTFSPIHVTMVQTL